MNIGKPRHKIKQVCILTSKKGFYEEKYFSAIIYIDFFNVSLAVRISNSETNAPKPSRLSQQERQNIIEMQKQEVSNASPKRLRPLERVSLLAAKIKQKSRSVPPTKRK